MILRGPLPLAGFRSSESSLHLCQTCKLLLESVDFNLARLPRMEKKWPVGVDVRGEVSKGRLDVVFPGGCFSVAGDWPGLSDQSGKRAGETGCRMPRCLLWQNKQPYFYPFPFVAFVASTATGAVSVPSLLGCPPLPTSPV